jgi:hypothetical protein
VPPFASCATRVRAPDELAPSYVRAYAAAYRKANAEADAAEEARNAEAGRDLSPAEFRELVSAECPGRRWKVQIWSYIYSDHYPESMNDAAHHATVFYGPDDDKGVPLKADNLRDLARLMREAHEHMGRAGAAAKLVPVVEVATA